MCSCSQGLVMPFMREKNKELRENFTLTYKKKPKHQKLRDEYKPPAPLETLTPFASYIEAENRAREMEIEAYKNLQNKPVVYK